MTEDEIRRQIQARALAKGDVTLDRATAAANDLMIAIKRTIPNWRKLKWPSLELRLRKLRLEKDLHGAAAETSVGIGMLAVWTEEQRRPNLTKAQARGVQGRLNINAEEKRLLKAGAEWLLHERSDLNARGMKEHLLATLLHGVEYRDANGNWRPMPNRSINELSRWLTHLRPSRRNEDQFRFRAR